MVGKDRHNRALHEAGHAVIARKLEIGITHVNARLDHPEVPTRSAGYLARGLDVPGQIAAYENDAKVALAGFAANRREHPHLQIYDVLTDDMDDMQNARSAIYGIVCLKSGQRVPDGTFAVPADEDLQKKISDEHFRLEHETARLIEQHWPAIQLVAKHLEKHSPIDQAEVDRLIGVAERRR